MIEKGEIVAIRGSSDDEEHHHTERIKGFLSYFKDDNGIVHLRGVIDTGTVDTTAFTLPTGYRPPNDERLVTISNNAIGRVNVLSTGAVVPATPSVNTWVSLDGLTFKAT